MISERLHQMVRVEIAQAQREQVQPDVQRDAQTLFAMVVVIEAWVWPVRRPVVEELNGGDAE